MDIKVISEEKNPTLHRTDVRFEIVYEEAASSRPSVRNSPVVELNEDFNEVVVHEFDTKFGMRKTTGYARVYESPEFARDVEQDHMLERNKITDTEVEAEET